MKIYKLTKLGREAVKNRSGDADSMRVLDYLADGSASDDQLEVAGDHYLIRTLQRHGLIKEVTS